MSSQRDGGFHGQAGGQDGGGGDDAGSGLVHSRGAAGAQKRQIHRLDVSAYDHGLRHIAEQQADKDGQKQRVHHLPVKSIHHFYVGQPIQAAQEERLPEIHTKYLL